MTKTQKLIIIIVSVAVALALAITAIVLIVNNNKREKTQTTILTCSLWEENSTTINSSAIPDDADSEKPQIQIILNGNEKVMRVVALNNEGKALILNAEFIGLNVEEATNLFVKLTTEAGYIDLETEGTIVNIAISGLNKDYSDMKSTIIESINSYFDENGIIAGAISNITDGLKDAVLAIKNTATDVNSKTENELMEQYNKIANIIEDLNLDNLQAFYTSYDSYYADYLENKEKAEQAIANFEELLKTLAGDEAQVIQQNLEQAKLELQNLTNKFSQNITRLQQNLTMAETALNNLKNNFKNQVEEMKNLMEQHRNQFQNNKEKIQKQINDFRQSLSA